MSKRNILLVLVVDDDPDFQLVLRDCLKKEGYACLSAVGVEEALKLVGLSAPDLVILDLGLRRASGFAFLENLPNAITRGEKVPPVLVVSGYCDPEIVDMATRLGAVRVIPKPIGSSQIVSAIRSFIG